jgi:hypothetical protein
MPLPWRACILLVLGVERKASKQIKHKVNFNLKGQVLFVISTRKETSKAGGGQGRPLLELFLEILVSTEIRIEMCPLTQHTFVEWAPHIPLTLSSLVGARFGGSELRICLCRRDL